MIRYLTVSDANALLRDFESLPVCLVGAYRILDSECFLFDRIGGKRELADIPHDVIIEANCAWMIVLNSMILACSIDTCTDDAMDLNGKPSPQCDYALQRLIEDESDGLWREGGAMVRGALVEESNSLMISFVNGAELVLTPRDPVSDGWGILRSGRSQIQLWRGSLSEVLNLD